MPSALTLSRFDPVGMVVVHDQTLTTATASFDVQSLPQGYKHLVCEVTARSTDGASNVTLRMRLNNDSGANYDYAFSAGYASGATGNDELSQTSWQTSYISAAGSSAGLIGASTVKLLDYASTTLNKSMLATAMLRYSSTIEAYSFGGHWNSTAAINRITIYPSAGNFVAGSHLTIYGLGGAPTGSVDAAQVAITDTAANYTATDVEGVLAEIAPEIGLPYYSPDRPPASPSATDDEFNDNSLAGAWTTYNSPDTVDESTLSGLLKIEDDDNTECGIYKTYAPGANAFTVITKVYLGSRTVAFSYGGIKVTDSGGTALGTQTIQWEPATTVRVRTGPTGASVLGSDVGQTGPFYLAIMRDSSTNYQTFVSKDGIAWMRTAVFSQAGTVDRIYLGIFAISTDQVTACFDFVRVFNSQTLVIGS